MDTEALAKLLYETALKEGAVNDLRKWDSSDGTQQYDGSTWKVHHPGLQERDKVKWRRVAARIEREL